MRRRWDKLNGTRCALHAGIAGMHTGLWIQSAREASR